MIFPVAINTAKEDGVSPPNEQSLPHDLEVETGHEKLKLNIFGLVFNLSLSLMWLYLAYHFVTRLKSEHKFFYYTGYNKTTDKFIVLCNSILSAYHFIYCVIPRLGIGELDFWQAIIPGIAVYGQILMIFYHHLLRDEHYGNYMWSIPLIMGTISVGILTSNDSDGKNTILLFFKPWIIVNDDISEQESTSTEGDNAVNHENIDDAV